MMDQTRLDWTQISLQGEKSDRLHWISERAMSDTEVAKCIKCIRNVFQLEMRENLKIQNTHTKENQLTLV